MRNWIPLFLLIPSVFLLLCCSIQPENGEKTTAEDAVSRDLHPPRIFISEEEIQTVVSSGNVAQIAQLCLNLVSGGDFQHPMTLFSPALKEKMSPARLQKWWEANLEEMGPFKRRGAVGVASEKGRTVIYVGCCFEQGIRDLRVEFNSHTQIEDLSLVPTGVFQGLPVEIKEIVEPETNTPNQ